MFGKFCLESLFGIFRKFVWDALGGVNGAAGAAGVLSNSSLQPLKTPTPPCPTPLHPHCAPLPPIQIPLSPADLVPLSVWLHQIAASSQSSAEAGRGCQGVLIQSPAALFNSRFTAGAAAAAAAAARRLRRGSSSFWCLKNIVIVFLPSHQTPKINFSFLSSETDKFFSSSFFFFHSLWCFAGFTGILCRGRCTPSKLLLICLQRHTHARTHKEEQTCLESLLGEVVAKKKKTRALTFITYRERTEITVGSPYGANKMLKEAT